MIKNQQDTLAAALGLDARWLRAVDGRPVYYLSGRLPLDWKAPDGWVIVHNHIQHGPNARSGTRGFRVWLAQPAKQYIVCECGWVSNLGEHYCVAGIPERKKA
jgi:hypothetical protein